jgi:cellulose biosynthesis protein BcsQ
MTSPPRLRLYESLMPEEPEPRPPGTVYTFYSYKGGVGRSMAVANVGALLALAGQRVLLVDWDLEAPGLETYFRSPARLAGDPAIVPGVVDLLHAQVEGEPLHWTACLLRAYFLETGLDIISAGQRSADYRHRVQSLDWESMYREHRIGNYVNALREEWRDAYDFVLIDSRTGVTDIGDICTVLLPDALVLMFVTSYQNVEGIKGAMARALAARSTLPVNRSRLVGIPLPARDEVYNEYEKSLEWKAIYARELGYLYEDWLPKEVSPADALNKLFIPYVTNWSFGERIPVLESARETQDPTSLGAAYQRLTNLLMTKLDWYSLEKTATIEDLQAANIELQRERHRSAREKQRTNTWRVAALSAALLAVIVAAVLLKNRPVQVIVDPVTSGTSGTSITSTAPTSRLAELDVRSRRISEYLSGLRAIRRQQLPEEFFGPIDEQKVSEEIRRWDRTLTALGSRQQQCGQKVEPKPRNDCVDDALTEFPAPRPLPPPGRIFPVAVKRFPSEMVISLTRSEPTIVIEPGSSYTDRLTVLVKGEWGGHPALPCADVVVAAIEFSGSDRTFSLWDPQGRDTAGRITGRMLRPIFAFGAGKFRDDVAVMEGWPAGAKLSARLSAADRYGINSTACPNDPPYVLIWQNDPRFNSSDPYAVLALLTRRPLTGL